MAPPESTLTVRVCIQNAGDLEVVCGAFTVLMAALAAHGHAWTVGERAAVLQAGAALERLSLEVLP